MLMRLDKIRLGSRGFTLVELMIVVGILGLLGAVAFPMIASTLPNYRLRAAARELVIDFKKAKVEAIKRNRSVLLVFTPETAGDPDAGGSYQMCVDDNGNSVCDAGEGLKTVTMPRGVRIFGTTVFPTITATTSTWTGYNNRGLPVTATGAVTLQNSDVSRVYTVTMSASGGVRLQ